VSLTLDTATPDDVPALVTLRNAAGAELTRRFGHGHWSSCVTEKGALRALAATRVLVAREGGRILGTLRLATKKPWAIDPDYFTAVRRPLYLLDMAVDPAVQGRGVGRALLECARAIAREWPADAIRLDAYDALAGAGGFYDRCGYREVGRVVYRGVPLVYYELVLGSRERSAEPSAGAGPRAPKHLQ
jgi:GNAT superfamily N-acetyltransferase